MLGALVGLALLLFLAGELVAWLASDPGRLALYRHLRLGDRAHVVRIVGDRIARGLALAGVPRERVQESVLGGPGAPGPAVRWRVDLPPDGAPLKLNYAVTRAVEEGGAAVLSGRERPGETGALVVTLLVGVPGRPTHELEIVRAGRPRREPGEPVADARLALVLLAAPEDAAQLERVCARPEPFAVAVVAGAAEQDAELRAARAGGHAIVLLLPMEPANYPRVDPGPHTLLVSMSPGKVAAAVRRELQAAHGAIAAANLMGGFATQDETFMRAVYGVLHDEGVSFLHLDPVPHAVCKPLAARLGVAYDTPDVTLDAGTRRPDLKALDRGWSAALAHARARGRSLVVLRVTAASAAWLERALAPKRLAGVRVVPASALLHRPAAL
ncbi:MAG TPA: divergent polysaccharide deacetylase family protein [Candidatus Eisenbacteria bacterium]|nr:divergent polysaccharide deacetylase family protein [Candidatus Eisenbacteria bacterium]